MKLIDNYQHVLRKAWSIRLILIAGTLSGFEMILPLIDERMPRGAFTALSFLVTIAAFVARLLAQQEVHDDQL